MSFATIAFEISNTGFVRELNAHETARALADIRRWREKTAESPRSSSLKRLAPDRLMLGSVIGAVVSVMVALCQIAGAI